MKLPAQLLAVVLLSCSVIPAFAQEPAHRTPDGARSADLALDGKSFEGRIRATGPIGLFRVKGRLSFAHGMLTWSAKGADASAPYSAREGEGVVTFAARVPADAGTHVDWSGAYDGKSLSNVKAVWTRTGEKDFIHDLFLPDVVTLVFEEATD